MAGLVRLCAGHDVPEGSARGFDPGQTGRDTMFLVRRAGLRAFRNSCPHWRETSMAWRKDAFLNRDATRIVCAAHGAQFDIETGVCLLGPCIGEKLTAIGLTTLEDGSVWVDPADVEITL